MTASMQHALTRTDGLRYGLLGMPLAFVALPLYVLLPNHYAREFGVPLAVLGALLLAVRVGDAVLDPWLGRITDRLFAGAANRVLRWGAMAAVLIGIGFAAIFFPPSRGDALLPWAAVMLFITSLGFSALTIAHQAWGAMLGEDDAQRGAVVAWREGFGLAGVLLASLLPLLAGFAVSAAVLCMLLAAGCWAWARGPRPPSAARAGTTDWRLPLQQPRFRQLIAIFLLNGIASAVPATLVLFFVQDRLQAAPAMEPLFLGSYFVAAAVALPFWLAQVRRRGLAPTWLAGMGLAVAAFSGASLLGAGDAWLFVGVCVLSGAALGTDLALPAALLAREIQAAGHGGRAEGAYFGWWNFAGKLNLALAAGLALPLLALAGYTPGARSPEALRALTLAYCALPCALKLAAAALLHWRWIRPGKIA